MKYSKLASDADQVVVATPMDSRGSDRSPTESPRRSNGTGLALACIFLFSLCGGAFFFRTQIEDYWSGESGVFIELGSGSSAVLFGPYAGSGLVNLEEELAVLEAVEEAVEAAEAKTDAPTVVASSSTASSSASSSAQQKASSTASSSAPASSASVTTAAAATDAAAVVEEDAAVAGPDPVSPDTWSVTFATTVVGADGETAAGTSIVVKVVRAWAPLGADHFYALVKDGFYNEAAFFRVVPNFVVQFGIAGVPAENKKWSVPIKDDPVLQSNKAATLVYATAGPNTRTSQLFINYKDNSNLDSQGFAPFATVTAGFDYAQEIFNPTPGSSDGVDQGQYTSKGNDWIKQAYPHIDFIINATIQE
jgi:cyclophilin family peptidyl-prolyl cis-trans isomerase